MPEIVKKRGCFLCNGLLNPKKIPEKVWNDKRVPLLCCFCIRDVYNSFNNIHIEPIGDTFNMDYSVNYISDEEDIFLWDIDHLNEVLEVVFG